MHNIISGSGSYIAKITKTNADFINASFYDENKRPLPYGNDVIIEKFEAITGISERRYIGN